MSHGHEVVLVSIANGDVGVFLNATMIYSLNATDVGEAPKDVADRLALALGVSVRDVSMDTPADSDWNWDDVCELLPPTEASGAEPWLMVSLDGGVTYEPAREGVRLIYPDQLVPGEDEDGELHINMTHEGIIMDVWVTREEHLDHNIGTSCRPLEDLICGMVEAND